MERVLIVLALVALVLAAAMALRRRRRSSHGPSRVDPGELGLEHPGIGVVEFASPYCAACRAWAAALDDAGIPFEKVDLGERPELAGRYRVRETPLVLAVRVPEGEVVAAHSGDPDPDALRRLSELSA